MDRFEHLICIMHAYPSIQFSINELPKNGFINQNNIALQQLHKLSSVNGPFFENKPLVPVVTFIKHYFVCAYLFQK